MTTGQLTLASKSTSRRQLLKNAGLQFDCIDSELDEDAVKQAFLADQDQDPADVAMILAQAKAATVSEKRPDCLVIGADQVLICDGKLYSKPRTDDEAREHLLALSGRSHVLETAIAIAEAGKITWSYREAPHLTMRTLTPQFIGHYMAAVGR